MLNLDWDTVNEMAVAYLEHPDKNSKIADDVSYFLDEFNRDVTVCFRHGEVYRVLNSFKLEVESEDTSKNMKAVKGIKSQDVAYIAAHVGFIAGILHAENLRINFF